MEYTDVIFMIGIAAVAAVAVALYNKLEAMNDLFENMDLISDKFEVISDRIDDLESSIEEEFEDDGEDTTAQVLLQEWEDSVITSISRLENQMNSHISEISDLRNMIAGLNQQLGEVAAFADRLNGRIDEMQNK